MGMAISSFLRLFERASRSNPFVLSKVTKRFKKSLAALPPEVQSKAKEAYERWRNDMSSVDFSELKGMKGVYRVEIGLRYRALGHVEGNNFIWDWIGSHELYNSIINRR